MVSTILCKAKSAKKTFLWQFYTTSKIKCSNLRPLCSTTLPQGFGISKDIGHQLQEMGTLKRYLKSEHTDTHTDTHMDKSTYREHRVDALKSLLFHFNLFFRCIHNRLIHMLHTFDCHTCPTQTDTFFISGVLAAVIS